MRLLEAPAVSLDPLAADGLLAFLAVLGPLAVVTPVTGVAIGTTIGTETGTAIGTADPEVAGATVWAEATAMTARKVMMDLNMLTVESVFVSGRELTVFYVGLKICCKVQIVSAVLKVRSRKVQNVWWWIGSVFWPPTPKCEGQW